MNGPYFTNLKGKVLSVGSDVTHDTHMRHVRVLGLNKSRPEQKFEILYLDQWKRDPVKGELNRDFGFRVDVDFHIVSELASRRYVENYDSKPAIKTPNGRPHQRWYFNQATRTIKSRATNQSIAIQSNGRG